MNLKESLTHCYRIALIGSTSSGKTCMLAEMAAGHNASPRFGCSINPQEFKKLTDTEISNIDKDPNLRLRYNFQRGMESLEEAQKQIKTGQRPAPTSSDQARPMMKFKLSDSEQRGDFYVWTEDYAGELLNVAGLQDEKSLSWRLKQNLLRYDALIIVIDTINSEEEGIRIRKQIDNLNKFFTALTDEQKKAGRPFNIPVAIILSKWDRYSQPIDFANPKNEQEKLKKYLKEHPEYNALIKAVGSNAIENETVSNDNLIAGVSYGNAAVFPSSAFGRAIKNEKGEELPDPQCQDSFCLVEPYYWAANRSDELEVGELESQLKPMWSICPTGLKNLRIEAKKTNKRMSKKALCKKRLKSLLSKSLRTLIAFYVIWFIIFAIAGDAIWGGINQLRVKSWEITINNPDSSIETLSQAKESLILYKKTPYRGTIAPKDKRVTNDIEQIDKKIDNIAWKPVDAAKELANKAGLAMEYLKKHPSGTHAAEANKIVQAYLIQKEEDAWRTVEGISEEDKLSEKAKAAQKYLDEYDTKGTAIHREAARAVIRAYAAENEEACWKLVTDAIRWSNDQKLNAESYLVHYPEGTHRDKAIYFIQQCEKRIQWEKDLGAYNEECSGANIGNIIKELKKLISKYEITNDYCKPLITRLPGDVEDKLDIIARKNTAETMIDKCEKAADALRGLETLLNSRNEETFATSVRTTIQMVNQRKVKNIAAFDKVLYAQVVKKPIESTCNTYLRKLGNLGGGAMINEVKAYREYLNKKEKARNATLKFDLFWGPQTPVYQVRGQIEVDKKSVFNELHKTWNNAKKELTTKTISSEPSEKIEIKVSFVSEDNSWGNKCIFGEGTNSVYLSELCKGHTIKLQDNYGYHGEMTITEVNSPAPPALPQWKEKK